MIRARGSALSTTPGARYGAQKRENRIPLHTNPTRRIVPAEKTCFQKIILGKRVPFSPFCMPFNPLGADEDEFVRCWVGNWG